MTIIPATEARKRFSELVNQVRYSNHPVVIGRHDTAEVLMIKFPASYNPTVDETTNMNQYGGGFDFLEDEPDIYSYEDLKNRYV